MTSRRLSAGLDDSLEGYLDFIKKVSKYKGANTGSVEEGWYLCAGLAGESGEVCDEIKKLLGHSNQNTEKRSQNIKLELGDAFFHIVKLADYFNLTMEEIIEANKKKLLYRYNKGIIHSG